MPAFRLYTKENEEVDLFFREGQSCELTVKNGHVYEFDQKDGVLKITWTIVGSSKEDTEFQSEFRAIRPLAFDDGDLDKKPQGLTNCCSIGDREWCVRRGCLNAPCGRICG